MILAVFIALFAADNAEFFENVQEGYDKGMTWHYTGKQVRDPKVPSLPIINEQTGEEYVYWKLK